MGDGFPPNERPPSSARQGRSGARSGAPSPKGAEGQGQRGRPGVQPGQERSAWRPARTRGARLSGRLWSRSQSRSGWRRIKASTVWPARLRVTPPEPCAAGGEGRAPPTDDARARPGAPGRHLAPLVGGGFSQGLPVAYGLALCRSGLCPLRHASAACLDGAAVLDKKNPGRIRDLSWRRPAFIPACLIY